MIPKPRRGGINRLLLFGMGLALYLFFPAAAQAGAEVDPGWIIYPAAIALLVILSSIIGGIVGVVIVLRRPKEKFGSFLAQAGFVFGTMVVGGWLALMAAWIGLSLYSWLK